MSEQHLYKRRNKDKIYLNIRKILTPLNLIIHTLYQVGIIILYLHYHTKTELIMRNLKIIPGLMAAAMPLVSCQQEKATEPINVIYILCDDMGYRDIEVYGQEKIETPSLNRMAEEGMKFTSFYAGTSVSAPSRASLMTGQHTGHTQIRGNKEIQPEGQAPLDPNVKTIAEMFKAAGYTTGCFGKWGLGYPGSGSEPINRGFDSFFGYNCQRYAHSYYPAWLWENDKRIEYPERNVYSQDEIHKHALQFIRDNKDKPFFGYFTYTIPHAELSQPQDSIVDMYRGRWEEPNPYPGDGDYCPTDNPRTQFAAMITRLDTYVGEIMDELDKLGIAEKTLLIFTSDNGPHQEGGADPWFFNAELKFRGLKRALYEGGTRVPFIVYWPGTVKPGTVNDMQAASWDMMPTFVELTGMKDKWTQKTDGISILPAIKGQEQNEQHEFLYWEFHEEGGRQAVRKGDWKLIRQNIASGNPTLELYNLATDEHENTNIIEQHPDVATELEAIMDREHTHSDMFNFGLPQKQQQ